MFGIKLKVLEISGILYDLNGSHSFLASSQYLNRGHPDPGPIGVIMGHP